MTKERVKHESVCESENERVRDRNTKTQENSLYFAHLFLYERKGLAGEKGAEADMCARVGCCRRNQ